MQTEVATMDQARIDLIKETVAKGATDLEFELFMHACNKTGLDPLMKQLYAIKRWSQADGREVMAFQTGIDGLRLIADRTKLYAGSDDAIFSGVCKEDDFKATVTVWKLVNGERCAFTASARWPEYVQKKKDGTATKFWTQMPFGQLGKCAESLALRKAFPMELSNLYTHEEMVHLDSEWKPTVRQGAEMLAELEKREPPTELETQLRDSLKAQDDKKWKQDKPVDAPEAVLSDERIIIPGAPAPTDDPAEPYRARLRTAQDDKQARERYEATPETLKQDVYSTYLDRLKELGKKGKK